MSLISTAVHKSSPRPRTRTRLNRSPRVNKRGSDVSPVRFVFRVVGVSRDMHPQCPPTALPLSGTPWQASVSVRPTTVRSWIIRDRLGYACLSSFEVYRDLTCSPSSFFRSDGVVTIHRGLDARSIIAQRCESDGRWYGWRRYGYGRIGHAHHVYGV